MASKTWVIAPAGPEKGAERCQVTFITRFKTIGSEAVKNRLAAAFAKHHVAADGDLTHAGVMNLLALILSCTQAIHFELSEGAGDELLSFRDFWEWYCAHVAIIEPRGDQQVIVSVVNDEALLAEVWSRFVDQVGTTTQDEWYDAYVTGQNLYPAASVIAPEATLAPEQLKDEDFLASGG